MDTFKAEYEFYNSNNYLIFAKRLKAYSKIPTLDEMDPYTTYPVQTVDGTSIFSLSPPAYCAPPPPPYSYKDGFDA